MGKSKREPDMKSIPRVRILAMDWNGMRWLECGIQDESVVSIFGRVGELVPLRIEYVPQRDSNNHDPAGCEAFRLRTRLEKSGYMRVEVESVFTPPLETFTFTTEDTSPKWKDGRPIQTEFSHLHLACPCCGQTGCVVMPGDSDWCTNHKSNPARRIGEPVCIECRGTLRLLPKRPLTADMLAAIRNERKQLQKARV